MNRTQYRALLEAISIDKNNLLKYRELYQYAYILSDGIFKVVFAEEKSHSLLISLVNAMLDLQGGEAIKDITLEMQEFPGMHPGYHRHDQRWRESPRRSPAEERQVLQGPRRILHLARHREPGPY